MGSWLPDSLLLVLPSSPPRALSAPPFTAGPWKRAAEDFLATFQPTYVLKEKRIGSPGTVDAATGTRFASGGVVRVLRCYPGRYTNHAVAANGASQLMDATDAEPGYQVRAKQGGRRGWG